MNEKDQHQFLQSVSVNERVTLRKHICWSLHSSSKTALEPLSFFLVDTTAFNMGRDTTAAASDKPAMMVQGENDTTVQDEVTTAMRSNTAITDSSTCQTLAAQTAHPVGGDQGGVAAGCRIEQPCRLFKLPTELRVQIYRELLVFNDTQYEDITLSKYSQALKDCWPSIIVTCRQAYEEANDILYADNEFGISISYGTRLPVYALGHEVRFNGRHLYRLTTDEWPSFLLKAKRIRLFLTTGMSQKTDWLKAWLAQANRIINHLHGFLLGRSHVGKITVELEVGLLNESIEGMWADTISPARLIAPTIELTTRGVTEHTARDLKGAITPVPNRWASVVNLLRKAHELRDEARLRLEFLGRQVGSTPEYALIESYKEMLTKLLCEIEPMTVESEYQLEKWMRKLDRTLEAASIDDITTAFESVVRDYERIQEITQARMANNAGA